MKICGGCQQKEGKLYVVVGQRTRKIYACDECKQDYIDKYRVKLAERKYGK